MLAAGEARRVCLAHRPGSSRGQMEAPTWVEHALVASRDQRVQTPNTSLRASSITGHSSPNQPAYVPAVLFRSAYSAKAKIS